MYCAVTTLVVDSQVKKLATNLDCMVRLEANVDEHFNPSNVPKIYILDQIDPQHFPYSSESSRLTTNKIFPVLVVPTHDIKDPVQGV